MLYTWNENTPADTDLVSGGDDVIRELKKAIRERLDVEHIFTTGNESDVGKHNAGFITEANGYLGDASVVTNKIKDSNVTTPKIADLSVTEAKLADAGVTTSKIADGAVTTPKLPDSGVTTTKVADGAVTLIKIAPNARGPGSTFDADTVDGVHASGFATASEGVSGGNQHNHSVGDGGQIDHNQLANRGTLTHEQLEALTRGFTLPLFMPAGQNPSDGSTFYVGYNAITGWGPSLSNYQLRVPKSGTIKSVWVMMYSEGGAGSAEDISAYILVNGAGDTLIQTVGISNARRDFANYALNVAVSAGDYVVVKFVCPAWATNPLNCGFTGIIFVE